MRNQTFHQTIALWELPTSELKQIFLGQTLMAMILMLSFLSSTSAANNPRPGAAELFQDGDRILFLGDSITQDGRYVDLIRSYLWSTYPTENYSIMNAGLGSETVSGLTEPIHPFPRPNVNDRVARALELTKPNWVFICYGMNDGIYHPYDSKIRDAFLSGMEQLLTSIHNTGAKVILLTPPAFDIEAPNVKKALTEAAPETPYGYQRPYEKYHETLGSLSHLLKELEQDPRVHLVIDVQNSTRLFLAAAKKADPSFTYGDGIHPPLTGHAAIATAILVGLGHPHEEVSKQIAWITAIQPVGNRPTEYPVNPDASSFREELFKTGRQVNQLWRSAISPSTPEELSVQQANKAKELAKLSYQALRQRVRRIKPEQE